MKCVTWILLLIFYTKDSFQTTVINCDTCQEGDFQPTWDSLDKRKLPKWYDEAKFGIFLHWGVYSVPGFKNEWFWYDLKNKQKDVSKYVEENFPPNFSYQEFAKDFTAEFFEPEAWADLFKRAGAKYIVLTSKHHEGYTLWPSEFSFSWNSKDVGPHRDLLGDLAIAIRNKTDIKFGVYHSLYEWYNPMYLSDKAANFSKNTFVKRKVLPEMMELVEKYKPEVIWSDGDWEASDNYWQSKEFLAWLYNESPVKDTVVVNDRWGQGTACHHGDFYNCEDGYDPGKLLQHKWESATTVYKGSWGYLRNTKVENYRTTAELIALIARTVSCGGNVLLNVGPTKEGTIAPIFQERLLEIGQWLSLNGEAIYTSTPWTHQNDSVSLTWYTAKSDTVYAITLAWPEKNLLRLGLAYDLFKSPNTSVTLLGNSDKLKWRLEGQTVAITFPDKATVNSRWAYTVRITGFH